jgi:hypothetical protein
LQKFEDSFVRRIWRECWLKERSASSCTTPPPSKREASPIVSERLSVENPETNPYLSVWPVGLQGKALRMVSFRMRVQMPSRGRVAGAHLILLTE